MIYFLQISLASVNTSLPIILTYDLGAQMNSHLGGSFEFTQHMLGKEIRKNSK